MLSLIFAATAFSNVSIFVSLRPFSAASFHSGRTPSFLGLFFSAFPQSSTITCTQNHHLSSPHNHHGPIIHCRCLGSPQLSNPTIPIIALANRYICAAPLLSYAIYAFAAGAISDSLIAKGRLSRLNMQKVFCLFLASEHSHLDLGEHWPGIPGACHRHGAHVLRRHSRPRSDLCRRSCCHFCLQRGNQRRAHPEHHWTCAK